MKVDEEVFRRMGDMVRGSTGWVLGLDLNSSAEQEEDGKVGIAVVPCGSQEVTFGVPKGLRRLRRFVIGRKARGNEEEEEEKRQSLCFPAEFEAVSGLACKALADWCLVSCRIKLRIDNEDLWREIVEGIVFLLPDGSLAKESRKTCSEICSDSMVTSEGVSMLRMRCFHEPLLERDGVAFREADLQPVSTIDCVAVTRRDSLVARALEQMKSSIKGFIDNECRAEKLSRISLISEQVIPSMAKMNASLSDAIWSSMAVDDLGLPGNFPKIRSKFGRFLEFPFHKTPPIRSPHKSALLQTHGLGENASVVKIIGDVDYHHYRDDDIDDVGWGCAYRSLQMVMSWFVLNGFPKAFVPSIPEIQKILHDMKVMDSDFHVGCTQWIGSQEIGWVLSSQLGVQTRFDLEVNATNLQSNIGKIRSHLSIYHCPIVACGDNIALVILGIATPKKKPENGKEVDAKLLIADPHYVRQGKINSIYSDPVNVEYTSNKVIPVAWRSLRGIIKTKKFITCMPAHHGEKFVI